MRYKYREIEEGGDINIETIISQSVQVIELAAAIATDAKDVDALLKVSMKWLDFGERVSSILENMIEEDESEEPVKLGTSKPYGFHQNSGSIEEVEKDG